MRKFLKVDYVLALTLACEELHEYSSNCPDCEGECQAIGGSGRGESNEDDCDRWFDGALVAECWEQYFLEQAKQVPRTRNNDR